MWLSWILSFLTSKIGRIVAILGTGFLVGLWTGNSLTVKYYKAGEIAALNEQIKRNKKVIEAQTKYASELRDKELQLEEELENALEEARKSPTAGNVGLPSDSVRRLNKVR